MNTLLTPEMAEHTKSTKESLKKVIRPILSSVRNAESVYDK